MCSNYFVCDFQDKINCKKNWVQQAKSQLQVNFSFILPVIFTNFAGQFLHKSLIILLGSILQVARTYFIGSTKWTKKVLGLFTSNVVWLSQILKKGRSSVYDFSCFLLTAAMFWTCFMATVTLYYSNLKLKADNNRIITILKVLSLG